MTAISTESSSPREARARRSLFRWTPTAGEEERGARRALKSHALDEVAFGLVMRDSRSPHQPFEALRDPLIYLSGVLSRFRDTFDNLIAAVAQGWQVELSRDLRQVER